MPPGVVEPSQAFGWVPLEYVARVDPPTVLWTLDLGIVPERPQAEVLPNPDRHFAGEIRERNANVSRGIEALQALQLRGSPFKASKPIQHLARGFHGVWISEDRRFPASWHPE